MSVITLALEEAKIPYLVYADDLVIFHSHEDLNQASFLLNHALSILVSNLNKAVANATDATNAWQLFSQGNADLFPLNFF